MVIYDSVKTTEFDKKNTNAYNKAVFKMKMPEYAHHAACCMYWKRYIYVVGGELEGHWSNKAHMLDLESFEFKSIADLDTVVKMGSLAPLLSDSSPGVFIAGLGNEDGYESMIQFYSNHNNTWNTVDKNDDEIFSYDLKGGFPAFKYFFKDKKHFLLIAGGIDTDGNTSSKVQIISFTLNHV